MSNNEIVELANATPAISEAVLGDKFVIELLTLLSELRVALGDEKGDLENKELVDRARQAYKG